MFCIQCEQTIQTPTVKGCSFAQGMCGKTEIGVSALAGGLHDGVDRAGDYNAWALHLNSNMGWAPA